MLLCFSGRETPGATETGVLHPTPAHARQVPSCVPRRLSPNVQIHHDEHAEENSFCDGLQLTRPRSQVAAGYAQDLPQKDFSISP
jgi:hypothetical protein